MAKASKTTLSQNPPISLNEHPFFGLKLDDDQVKMRDAIWDRDKLIIFVNSCSGSGKTTIATMTAELLVKYGLYEGIIYCVSSYGEDRQGFLPGDITAKSEVFFNPFYQAAIKAGINPYTAICQESTVNQKNWTGYIACLTHTYLRGTNFENKVIILDEAQNFTVDDLKKTLTRCSDNCKVIVIGHDGQCDLNNKERSGFVRYMEHFSDDSRCAICKLTHNHRGWISQHADELM